MPNICSQTLMLSFTQSLQIVYFMEYMQAEPVSFYTCVYVCRALVKKWKCVFHICNFFFSL